MYYELFDQDTSTSRTRFVNVAAFTVSLTSNLAYRSSEVVDFCTSIGRIWIPVCPINSNLGPILPRFRDITAFVR